MLYEEKFHVPEEPQQAVLEEPQQTTSEEPQEKPSLPHYWGVNEMSDEADFRIENVVNVTAAVIGVSKERWKALKQGEDNVAKAQEVMIRKRFDILPVVSDSGIKEYFQTDNWNDYSSISRKKITDQDTINFETPLRGLIHGFASKSRLFFFLDNETEVVGLVSIVHLNSRQVKVYLYNLLSEFEIRLSHFLSSKVSDTELLEMELGKMMEESKRRYKEDLERGVDSSFVEYLYLSDVIQITAKKNLHTVLGYSDKSKFNSELWPLNGLRHQVAHPNSSIITDTNSVKGLCKKITRIEMDLSRLRAMPGAVC